MLLFGILPASLQIGALRVDATNFGELRHLVRAHDLTWRIFGTIKAHLASHEWMMREETIVDASMIDAPPLIKTQTNNAARRCISRRRERLALWNGGPYMR